LRATQFHDFTDDFVSKFLKFSIYIVPKAFKIQPIQVEVVAMELDKIVKGSPLNTAYDIGGKNIYNMGEIADSLLKARREKKLVLNMPVIGETMKMSAEACGTCENIPLNSNT
jgi:uncharacterized protein YbjT (DUF2867 family)